MEFISSWFDNLSNLGDPEIRTWFLVGQKSLPLLIPGFYVVGMIVIGPALMRNRKPFQLKNILMVYNFSLVIVYASFLIYLIRDAILLRGITYNEFCHGFVIKRGHTLYNLTRACWMIYLVKYIEYLDTVFFILRKKQSQVTVLHVAHHAFTPFCFWACLRTEKTGMALIPAIINAIVHVIMYSYYALSTFGPEVRKYLWWKKYLTQLQMAQFIFFITFATIVVPLSGCKMLFTSYIIIVIFGCLFLYLFYNYYRTSFKQKRASTKENPGREALNHGLQQRNFCIYKASENGDMPKKIK